MTVAVIGIRTIQYLSFNDVETHSHLNDNTALKFLLGVLFFLPINCANIKTSLLHGRMIMTTTKQIQTLLNGTISSLRSVIPISMDFQPPSSSQQPFEQSEMGVLIGIVGDIKGRIIIDSTPATFGSVGAAMFGMPLEGEMLESFTGELGNMIAGNLCTIVGQDGLELDITPPTVMVGNTKLYGFQKLFRLPAEIENIGDITILLTIDDED